MDGGYPASGSSPRMRGTHWLETPCVQSDGIIPAYAGNTEIDDLVKSLFGDHPRVCGEHHSMAQAVTADQGSSPRMRGTLDRHRGHAQRPGIIPAYVGNT